MIVMLFDFDFGTALPLSVDLKVFEKVAKEEVSGLDEPRALQEDARPDTEVDHVLYL